MKKKSNNLSKLSLILLVLFTMILFVAQNIKVPEVPTVKKQQTQAGFSDEELEKYKQIKFEVQQETKQTLLGQKNLKLPHDDKYFSIEQITDPTILYIHVNKQNSEKAKSDAIEWLKQQGIKDAEKLNIMWIYDY